MNNTFYDRFINVNKYTLIGAVIVILFLITSCGSKSPKLTKPTAVKGVIDLTSWNFLKNGSIPLDGEWEFYWGQLLTPEDFSKKTVPEPDFVPVPSKWNDFPKNLKEGLEPGQGHATYRIIVKLQRDDLAKTIRIAHILTGFKMWINNDFVFENGIVGSDRSSSVPNSTVRTATIKSLEKELHIVIQVANYYYNIGGISQEIRIGTDQQMFTLWTVHTAYDFFFCGCLLMMGIYHFFLFLLRQKDLSNVYFCITCLMIAIYTMLLGERLFYILFPTVPWEFAIKLLHGSWHTASVSLFVFLTTVFPGMAHRYISRTILGIWGLSISLIILSPARIFSYYSTAYQLFLLFIFIYIFAILIKASIQKHEGALIIFFGFLVLLMSVFNDVLFYQEYIQTMYLVPFGLLILIFSQSYVISSKFNSAFKSVELLSKELSEKNLFLLETDKLKDEFLSNTSHELRTPLNGIIGITESLIHGTAGELSEVLKKNILMIWTSSRRLFSLVNDLLDFSRLKNRDIALSIKNVDLRVAVDMVFSLCAGRIDKKKIELMNLLEEVPPVAADENRLQQILLNLVDNAIKFTESGHIKVSAEQINDEFIKVIVADTGIGIQPEKIERIFESFEQADGSIEREYGGTGLGLSITKKLVQMHGGSIRVSSIKGQGSSFIFTLPVFQMEIQDGAVDKNEKVIDDNSVSYDMDYRNLSEIILSESIGTKTLTGVLDEKIKLTSEKFRGSVLIVDDEPVNLQVLQNHFSIENYSVISTQNGIDALDYLSRGNVPDLVILDVMMPKISGIEVCKKLREDYSLYELPILILTAKNQKNDMLIGFEAGANDYISKPFNSNELLARSNTLVSLKKAVVQHNKLLDIEKEMDIARSIQRNLLPEDYLELRGVNIKAQYIPMMTIGGDYYDFHFIDEDKIGIIIADVSGHGISAALITSMVKVAFSLQKQYSMQPARLFFEMDRILKTKLKMNFVTSNYLFLDMKQNKLITSNAGHLPLLIYRQKTDTVFRIKPEGGIIGLIPNNIFEEETFFFEQGDRIILYTDGIIECINSEGKIIGMDNFINFIKKHKNLSAKDFTDEVLAYIDAWNSKADSLEDDVTIVVVDIL